MIRVVVKDLGRACAHFAYILILVSRLLLFA